MADCFQNWVSSFQKSDLIYKGNIFPITFSKDIKLNSGRQQNKLQYFLYQFVPRMTSLVVL